MKRLIPKSHYIEYYICNHFHIPIYPENTCTPQLCWDSN